MRLLREVAHYVTDKTHVKNVELSQYITTDNMLPNRRGITECEKLPEANTVTAYTKDDTLVSNIRPYFKKIWYANRSGGCSNDVLVFRINDINSCVSKFLYYVLSQDKFFNYMMAGANGTKMPRGNKKEILDFEIPCPPLEVQQKIASILSAYDDLIENNRRQIKLLEEAAQRLYKEWFVDLRFPGHENVKIIDGVPEGWIKGKISDCGKVITGKTPSTTKDEYYGGSIPLVKIPDMHNCVFPILTETTLSLEGAETQKNKYIPKNGIMVSCIATVGLVNIAAEKCQTNQQINSVVLYNEENLYYVYFKLKQLKELLEGVGSNGATMTNVNKTKFGNIPIMFPTSAIIKKFYDFSKPIFDKIYNISVNIVKLQEARDRLLPKLMSGEIEV